MRKLFLLSLSVAMLAACKKDNSTDGLKERALTSGTWKLLNGYTQIYLRDSFIISRDDIAGMDSCEQDNLFYFKSDHGTVEDPNIKRCWDDTGLVWLGGTWQFAGGESQLTYKFTLSPFIPTITADILKLDDQTLTLQYKWDVDTFSFITTKMYQNVGVSRYKQ